MRILGFIFALVAGISVSAAEIKPINKLDGAEREERLQGDAKAVLVHRDGLRDVIKYVESREDIFPKEQKTDAALLPREDKEALWNAWQRFLDYMTALASVENYHSAFYKLKGDANEDSFLIGYAAMLAQYRAALEFIGRAERNPGLDKILNDPVPELGLPGGAYAKLKFQYLNVLTAGDFAARETLMKSFSKNRQTALREAIRSDANYVWKAGKGSGEILTAKNALKVIKDGADTAWFPVQAGVSEWMGDTRVYRAGKALISEAQIKQLKLEPGDVLLERREWFLSNIGLPGFWSHAALYIGTPEERSAYFADADVGAWVNKQGEPSGDLERLLRSKSPVSYERSGQPQEHEHVVRVIEAMSEGVSFTTIEHSASCDSLAVLRPKLSKAKKAQAVLRAFHYAGRPYDFNFDFATDAELVCTELVYKSYEKGGGFDGLNFPLVEMLGRKVTPANDIAKQFDSQSEAGKQQYDLILFLDGHESTKNAVEASPAEFRKSWQRPKWHVLVQK